MTNVYPIVFNFSDNVYPDNWIKHENDLSKLNFKIGHERKRKEIRLNDDWN